MLKAEGTVVARRGDTLTVQSRTRSGCSHCAQQKQCGVGVISQAFPGSGHELTVPITVLNTNKPGDQVSLGVAEQNFLQAALWLYLPPLLGLLAGALLGQALLGQAPLGQALLGQVEAGQDLAAMLGGALGGGAGWLVGRTRLRRLPEISVQLLESQAVNAPCDDPKPEVR